MKVVSRRRRSRARAWPVVARAPRSCGAREGNLRCPADLGAAVLLHTEGRSSPPATSGEPESIRNAETRVSVQAEAPPVAVRDDRPEAIPYYVNTAARDPRSAGGRDHRRTL